ncbi:hypothetical protein BDN67DRAFT_595421 [Paxillus ammoniavirescens]|nr:hypothetical protein BDN67DRAFT_595421 [Paxillus ammoniavirescens]
MGTHQILLNRLLTDKTRNGMVSRVVVECGFGERRHQVCVWRRCSRGFGKRPPGHPLYLLGGMNLASGQVGLGNKCRDPKSRNITTGCEAHYNVWRCCCEVKRDLVWATPSLHLPGWHIVALVINEYPSQAGCTRCAHRGFHRGDLWVHGSHEHIVRTTS